MEQTKSLTAPIPASLHARVTEERIAANQSLGEYITNLLTDYYNNGGKKDMAQTRTLAFQIPDELFRQIKRHLERESERTGRKVTQREFVLGLIEDALREAEQTTPPASEAEAESATANNESQEGGDGQYESA